MIHRAKDLSPDQKSLVEGLLGRAIAEEDAISIRTLPAPSVVEWLEASWATSKRLGLDKITPEEIEAEIAEVRKARRNRQRSLEQ